MSNKNEEAVYKLNADCGRMGNLEGLFIAKKSHVKLLIKSGIKVYFGEVLGKHSEIYGAIEKDAIKMISDELNVIELIEKHDLENGYNPFKYTAVNHNRADFEDLTVLEIIEIIAKEKQ
jgi:hypothetical protein